MAETQAPGPITIIYETDEGLPVVEVHWDGHVTEIVRAKSGVQSVSVDGQEMHG